MKTYAPLVLLAALGLSSAPAPALTPEQGERIGAAFVLVLGRAPSAAELEQWGGQGGLPVAEMAVRLQTQGDVAARRAAADRACTDALGRGPAEDERQAGIAGGKNYTGLMQQHVQWLAAHPGEYAKVVERAYQQVLGRAAYAIEIDYWRAQPPLPFVLLNGCIENWARRNAPGLMATTGRATVSVNSSWLTAVRLSPAVAAEARAAAGLARGEDAPLAAEVGRNVIAAGAGAVLSDGGIHFVAAGRPQG